LHWAAYREDADSAALLVRAGADVNAANDLGVTPLSLACAGANAAITTMLLEAGADPNAASGAGMTPLMEAARTGNTAAAAALIAKGARVNDSTPAGHTALMWAVSGKHPGIVRVLLDHAADVKTRTRVSRLVVNRGGPNGTVADAPYVGSVEKGGFTPLLFAARQGDLESARMLLAAGADVHEKAPDGYGVLLMAAHSGHGEFAAFLLEAGADPNDAGAGFAPLHAAVLTGDLALVKALLTRGADVNAVLTQPTPIRRLGEDLAFPAPLVGATPYFLAAKYADLPIMRALIAAGADPQVRTKDGTTAVMAAAGVGWGGATNRKGVDVTANKAAASDPHQDEIDALEVVRFAADLGVDLNATNAAGESALFGAVNKGFTPVVKFLAERGAQLQVKNRRGQTLLSLTTPRATGTSATPASMFEATAAALRELGLTE
jgi:ankyrin repeat protein